MTDQAPIPGYSCQVFRAEDISVRSGANLGDPLGPIADLCEGDTYQLDPSAGFIGLRLDASAPRGAHHQKLIEGSQIGSPGDTVTVTGRLSLMAPDGDLVELLLLHHQPQADPDAPGNLLALPLSPLAPRNDYTLIRAREDPGEARLSDVVCVSFSQGTRITLPDGRQTPIETLEPDDLVLTRDHGPQPVRWIGNATLRAQGSFAPVVIAAGKMKNDRDLIVSQHHRMFLYRGGQPDLLPTAELLVQAKHLIDGENIFIREGGVMNYFSLAFDRHEIIYAEGIPAESLMVNEALVSRLPESLAAELRTRFPALSQDQHFATDADPALLERIGRKVLLKRGTE